MTTYNTMTTQGPDLDQAADMVATAMMFHAYQLEQWEENGVYDDPETADAIIRHSEALHQLTSALVCLRGSEEATEHRAWATQRAATRVHGD